MMSEKIFRCLKQIFSFFTEILRQMGDRILKNPIHILFFNGDQILFIKDVCKSQIFWVIVFFVC